MDLDTLAATWIELQLMPQDSEEAKSRMWAAEEFNLLAMRSPNDCWACVLRVLSLTDDDWVLTNLGAGPVENMLAINPEVSIELIEEEYPGNERLKKVVGTIWQNLMPDEAWKRLTTLAR